MVFATKTYIYIYTYKIHIYTYKYIYINTYIYIYTYIYIAYIYFIEFAIHIKIVLNLKEISVWWTRWVIRPREQTHMRIWITNIKNNHFFRFNSTKVASISCELIISQSFAWYFSHPQFHPRACLCQSDAAHFSHPS